MGWLPVPLRVAAIVYVFNLKKLYPILRPTILTGFISYILAALTLLVDLGFPQRIWHLITYWNIHSPLFEIGWCVMLYTTVLLLEFSPVVFEALGWKAPLKLIRSITIPLVILGVMLSTLHQSTLGTMMTSPALSYPSVMVLRSASGLLFPDCNCSRHGYDSF